MILKYKKNSPETSEIESKLKALSLAFKKEQYKSLKKPQLLDGKQEIIGKNAILEHLGEVEKELYSWYYCDC